MPCSCALLPQINRFLRHPGRPVVLAMSRPDAKKNVLGLLRAYGQSRLLRELTNLVLVLVSAEANVAHAVARLYDARRA